MIENDVRLQLKKRFYHIKNRCYRNSNYQGVSICDSFSTSEKFYLWAKEQIGFDSFDDNGKTWQIDKDICGDGSVYSPEVCVFVPAVLNSFYYDSVEYTQDTGVSIRNNKFVVRTRKKGVRVEICRTESKDIAIKAYQDFKIDYLMELSDRYYNQVDSRIFPKLLLKITNSFG